MLTAARRMNRARAVLPRRRRARRAAARRAARVIRRAPLPPGHPAARAARGRLCRVAAAAHRYNAGPALAGREVAVGLGAFGVTPVDPSTDEVVATCPPRAGRRPDGQRRPDAAAQTAVHAPRRARLLRQARVPRCASRPRGSTGRTCGSPRAGAATTCTFLSDIAMNIASMDY